MRWSEYLDTPAGQLSRYRWRDRHRVRLIVRGIEPRGKGAMPAEEQRAFQAQVTTQMRAAHRRPFRGKVALDVSLTTSAVAPAYPHTVAKNLLDLLGAPVIPAERRLRPRRGGILYYDDAQVDALCVSSVHGAGEPRIDITAVPMAAFLEDLGVAARAEGAYAEWAAHKRVWHESDDVAEWHRLRGISAPRDGKTDGTARAAVYGRVQAEAQRQWLQPRTDYLRALAAAFDAPTDPMWAQWVRRRTGSGPSEAPRRRWADGQLLDPIMRIPVGEPPHRSGMSARFRAQINDELDRFLARHRWLLDPLRISLALDVIVKPPPRTAAIRGQHDLDNLVRDYVLGPVTAAMGATADGGNWRRDVPRITQYRAWRLPRPEGDASPGYVSLGLSAEYEQFHGSVYDLIDRVMTFVEWEADARD